MRTDAALVMQDDGHANWECRVLRKNSDARTGMHLHAYAYGGDFRIWGNRSTDGGVTWSGWGQKHADFFL